MKKIAVLGSTGSIGQQTLEVIRRFPNYFKVVALSAGKNWQILARQTKEFSPEFIALEDKSNLNDLRKNINKKVKILSGPDGIKNITKLSKPDIALIALVGVSGLVPTLEAIDTAKVIALANKESLVVGGELVIKKAREKKALILPVDSEHSAIFQCLKGEKKSNLKKIILTSSGGPFRSYSFSQLRKATPRKALKHPVWKMGSKITIDSATLMNKGFEILEAKWLFDIGLENIEVIIHPEGVIHSLVEFCDGSVLAQMSPPDMRLPISYSLFYPQRAPESFKRLDLVTLKNITFYQPDENKFPCLKLARLAGESAGTYPAVLNAANESAVELFLSDKIKFLDIQKIIQKTLDKHKNISRPDLEDILEANNWARKEAIRG